MTAPSALDAVVEVRGLRKSYGAATAVAGLDLVVRPGEIVALLGPNGAGKSTTIEILAGLRSRDGGDVRVLGHDPAGHSRELRRRLGVGLQTTGLDPFLTVRETAELYLGYYDRPHPVADVLGLVGLDERAGVRVGRLSEGQRRRLDLAVAVGGDPELLLLDEPTAGLDPEVRLQIRRVIEGSAAHGRSVLLATHDLAEAEWLADRVVVIAAGRVLADGAPQELVRRTGAVSSIRFRAASATIPDDTMVAGVAIREIDGMFEAHTPDPAEFLRELEDWVARRGGSLSRVKVLDPSLEDVYLSLTAAAKAGV